jgi:hypothetical protein
MLKKYITTIFFIFILPIVLTFMWDPNTEPDLAGYRLYQSSISGKYTFGSGNEVSTVSSDKTTTSIVVSKGTWYWVITAFNNDGLESDPSNEVSYTVKGSSSDKGCFISILGGER